MAGTVLTNKGLALITKLVAAKATLSFTRVAVGTGSVPSGTDPQNMIELNAYKMDATIESYGVSSDQADVAYVTAQVSSVGVDAGFAVTETGVFATDPDEGEILYAYLDLTNDPQYIYAETDAISKFAEITLNVLIGSVESVTAIISPGALVKKADFDALEERVSNIETPEFDDSGSVSGITNFAEFLATLVSGMNIFDFFRNLKAGFQFVLHVGQLVSNTSTNNANLPASAAAVYQNAQAIAALNTEIKQRIKVIPTNFEIYEGKTIAFEVTENGGCYIVMNCNRDLFAMVNISVSTPDLNKINIILNKQNIELNMSIQERIVTITAYSAPWASSLVIGYNL